VPTQVVPVPLVSRRSIVDAYDPLHQGSVKARFQSLRAVGVVSAGVSRVLRRKRGQVAGTLHLYSELNREAARLYRRGDAASARVMAAEAAELEHTPDIQELVGRLASMDSAPNFDEELAWVDIQRLVTDSDFRALVQSASIAAATWRQQSRSIALGIESIGGIVSAVQSSIAVIETMRGAFAFPISQLSRMRLDQVGAAVEVEWEKVQASGSLVSVLPAIAVENAPDVIALTPYASAGAPPLPAERWARLRNLASTPGIEPPPLPVPLPTS